MLQWTKQQKISDLEEHKSQTSNGRRLTTKQEQWVIKLYDTSEDYKCYGKHKQEHVVKRNIVERVQEWWWMRVVFIENVLLEQRLETGLGASQADIGVKSVSGGDTVFLHQSQWKGSDMWICLVSLFKEQQEDQCGWNKGEQWQSKTSPLYRVK